MQHAQTHCTDRWRWRSPVCRSAAARVAQSQGQGRADAQLVRRTASTRRSSSARSAAIYDQEGIDLDIQEGRGSGVTVQAVAAGTRRRSATSTCRR